MSTPAVSPEPKKEVSWKRLFIKAAGFGAGTALMLAVLAGVGLWYINRPKPVKAWDNRSLKAEFRTVSRTKKDQFLFNYVVENTSDADYRLSSIAGVSIGARSAGYLAMCDDCVTLMLLPMFIPAHQKVLVPIQLNYDLPLQLKTELNQAKQEDEEKVVQDYIAKHYHKLNGFVLYDSGTRYEIDFPNGWATK